MKNTHVITTQSSLIIKDLLFDGRIDEDLIWVDWRRWDMGYGIWVDWRRWDMGYGRNEIMKIWDMGGLEEMGYGIWEE